MRRVEPLGRPSRFAAGPKSCSQTRADVAAMSTDDVQSLVHELQTHQVELELQNEELRNAQWQLAEARDSYVDLYEFAPVAYLTLLADRTIQEANLTAASLLMVERAKLVGARLEKWLAEEHRDAWAVHVARAMDSMTKEVCELAMCRGDGTDFVGHLEIAPVASGTSTRAAVCRVTISDISELRPTPGVARTPCEGR